MSIFRRTPHLCQSEEASPQKERETKKTFLWILSVMGRAKWLILFLSFLTTIQSTSLVVNALFLKGLIDSASAHNKEQFIFYVILFTSVLLFLVFLHIIENWFFEYSSTIAENRFKKRLFATLLHKDYGSVTAVHTGEWINRLTSDTAIVAENLATLFPWLAGMLVRITGALAVIYTILPWLGAIVVGGGLFIILITTSFKLIFKRLHKRIREADGSLRVFLSERLGSLLVLRVFSGMTSNEDQFDLMSDSYKDRRMERALVSNICGLLLGLLKSGAYLAGILICGFGILNGKMSYGTFAAVTKLVLQVQFPFSSIVGYIPKYFSMLASAERLMEAEEYLDDLPPEGQIQQEEINRFYQNDFISLGIESGSFSYPSYDSLKEAYTPVLDSFNLEIRKQDCVAFMGHSGCGKSTVLKILMGFYKLNSGDSFLRTGTKELSLTSIWRGLFAYVPQGNLLLNDTIRNLVAMGDPNRINDETAIRRALRIACADEFVDEFKEGIDTRLGERGSGLSEGQMQRIAIARAIFIDRPILLLDEATSALDEATEAKLLLNLKEMTDKTIITVTHRSSVLSICNRQIKFESD